MCVFTKLCEFRLLENILLDINVAIKSNENMVLRSEFTQCNIYRLEPMLH